MTIFSDAGFELHKWHSNASELEENPRDCINDSEDTYVKWDKVADTLAITFPQERAEPTKRGILGS